jgi:hypothetical protein
MVNILKRMKEKDTFFRKTDFENMFDAYDVFADRGNN